MPQPVAALAGDAAVFLELGAVLLALGGLARLAAGLQLSPIPFYLLAGLVLGAISEQPLTFSNELVEIGAQVGLALLLFTLGLEYDPDELSTSLRTNIRAGAADLVLNFTPGALLGVLMGWSVEAVLLLGGITYISSSGIVAKLVRDLGRHGHAETHTVLSVLVLEDLAMAVYLPVMGIVLAASGVWPGALILPGALLAIMLGFRLAMRRGHVLSRAAATPSDEALLLLTLAVGLLAAGAAEGLKLSAPVGAFLAGIALSGPVAERAQELVSPLRDLFAAAFFIFFAQQIDLSALPDVALAAVALTVVATFTKVAAAWIGAPSLPPAARVRAGTALAARGEFSIVIAGLGVGVVEPRLGPLAAAFVLLTAFTAPFITRLAERRERTPIAAG